MGVTLRQAGLYREIFPGEPTLPSMRPLVSDTPQPDETLIIQYLRSGRETSACGGFVPDAFNPAKRLPFVTMFTDGAWSWPSLLTYYVEHYHCRVPEGFVMHMRLRNWRAFG